MKKPRSITSILHGAKESQGHVQALKHDFQARLDTFKKERSSEDQQALEEDFNNVLEKWGIVSTENIGEVIFCLRLRLWILALVPGCYGVMALFMRTFNSLLVFTLLAIPCSFGVLTTAWRIWVLKNTRFVAFTRWLRAGCGRWL